MTAPHEIKKKDFTRTMRGYSTTEVDDYIEYVMKNYVDIYRLNCELEKKLEIIMARNNELSRDSEAVRTALLDAQKAAGKIVGEAKEEAELIIRSSKRSCDSILNEFRIRIAEERDKLVSVQNEISAFKAKLYGEYQEHIERVQDMTELADWSDIDLDDEAYTRRIITDIKSDVAYAVSERASSEREPVMDGPDPVVFDAANKAESETVSAAEAPDPASAEDDATKIFDVASPVIPEPLEVTGQSRIDEELVPEQEIMPATDEYSDPGAVDAAITEEYDIVLEKFADELANEAKNTEPDAADDSKEDK